MKYLSLIFTALIFMACSLASSGQPTIPPMTPTPVPSDVVNEMLSIAPIVSTSDDGTVVLNAGDTVTVRWDGLPDGSVATFTLSNFLVDGGVTSLGQGLQVTFTVPEQLEGEISASAQLPSGTTVQALSLPIVTQAMVTGDCRYIPPALGPGVTMYVIADMSGDTIGNVIYDADYIVVTTTIGLDDKGGEQRFYEIQHVDTGIYGWVPANVGETLAGNCSGFE